MLPDEFEPPVAEAVEDDRATDVNPTDLLALPDELPVEAVRETLARDALLEAEPAPAPLIVEVWQVPSDAELEADPDEEPDRAKR